MNNKVVKVTNKSAFSPILLLVLVVAAGVSVFVLLTATTQTSKNYGSAVIDQENNYSSRETRVQPSAGDSANMPPLSNGTDLTTIQKEIDSTILLDVEPELNVLSSEASGI